LLRCPMCGSSRVTHYLGYLSGEVYSCKDCGYIGPAVDFDRPFEDKETEEENRGVAINNNNNSGSNKIGFVLSSILVLYLLSFFLTESPMLLLSLPLAILIYLLWRWFLASRRALSPSLNEEA